MMIESNYYINVAKMDGSRRFVHFCNIELGWAFEAEAKNKFEILAEKFRFEDGWLLDLHYVECVGKEIVSNEIIKEGKS